MYHNTCFTDCYRYISCNILEFISATFVLNCERAAHLVIIEGMNDTVENMAE